MTTVAVSTAAAGGVTRRLRRRPELWLGLPCLIGFAALAAWQFRLGFVYESNESTNVYLRLARGSAYALLPLLVVLWLPQMRNAITALGLSPLGRWLPLHWARPAHRWLGQLLLVLSVIHGTQYLAYYASLERPLGELLFGGEPDLVRAMRTNMYDFVTDDDDIEATSAWIASGMPMAGYENLVQPFLQKDCTKCHNTTATRSYARTDMPMTTYEQVVPWTASGVASRQFRINVSGLVMLALCVVLWFTSRPRMRARLHHVFQASHRLGYGLGAAALLHVPSLHWLAVPVAVLACEAYVSRRIRLHRNRPARLVRVSAEVMRLGILPPAGMRLRPGHYVQVRIPALGADEWHAFSLTGEHEDHGRIGLKIRIVGDWTRRLAAMLGTAAQAELRVDVRGPWASPVAQALQHRDWLLIAGGIGVTPFLGLLRHLAHSGGRPRDVHMVWSLRDPAMLRWIEPLVARLAASRGGHVHWHVYVTGASTDSQGIHGIVLHHGRPDWAVLLARIAGHSPDLACFICGPKQMTREAAGHCRRRGWPVRSETFSP